MINIRQTVQRDTLFYKLYDHSIRLFSEHMYSLRVWDLDTIQHRLETGTGVSWRHYSFSGYWGLPAKRPLPTQENKDYILKLYQLLDEPRKSKKAKTLISGSYMNVYTSDLDLVDNLAQIGQPGDVIQRVEAVGSGEVMAFKNPPKHKYRMYFKNHTLTKQQKQTLKSIIDNNEVSTSNSLKAYFDREYNMLFEHYFLEFDDSGIQSMIALSMPDAIRKSVRCIHHK